MHLKHIENFYFYYEKCVLEIYYYLEHNINAIKTHHI